VPSAFQGPSILDQCNLRHLAVLHLIATKVVKSPLTTRLHEGDLSDCGPSETKIEFVDVCLTNSKRGRLFFRHHATVTTIYQTADPVCAESRGRIQDVNFFAQHTHRTQDNACLT